MARSRLRNRKTGDEFEVIAAAIPPVKLSKKSVFTEAVNHAAVEPFIQDFARFLPADMSEAAEQKILLTLRKELHSRQNEINKIIKHPEKIDSLLSRCARQLQSKPDGDKTTTFEFLKLIGTEIAKANLNTLFPGLGLLASLAAPAAATPVYEYFQGVPEGGEDLCAGLQNCIQGYIADINGSSTLNMPQIYRTIGDPEFLKMEPCFTQEHLKDLLGPYEGVYSSGCGAGLGSVQFRGNRSASGDFVVEILNVSETQCHTFQDKVNKLEDVCYPPSKAGLYLLGAVGAAAGISILGMVAYGLYCKINERKHEPLSQDGQTPLLNVTASNV